MRTNQWVVAMGLVGALGTAQTASAQAAHQGHDMKMPAMDDAHFVEMMKKHHQDGIELAKVEESRGSRDDVKALAAKIRQGQERDLHELNTKHAGHAASGTHADHKPHGTSGTRHEGDEKKHQQMMEQMGRQSKQKIESASGPAVDQAFIEEMSKHHQMALEMISKTKFKDPELRTLSQKMVTEQKQELAALKKLQSAR